MRNDTEFARELLELLREPSAYERGLDWKPKLNVRTVPAEEFDRFR